ncbi:MAG: hypothetical protein ACYST9_02245 [Planctomycetota bacterium]|jgi:beta propeller repeat protein
MKKNMFFNRVNVKSQKKELYLVLLVMVFVVMLVNGQAKAEFIISAYPSHKENPAVDGNIVVWEDYRLISGIYGYNLETEIEFPVYTTSASIDDLDISGEKVAWQEWRNGNNDIYGYNLETETEFPICTDANHQYSPSIDGNIVVWADSRNGNSDIYAYDINTTTEFPICIDSAGQGSPEISNNIVVWTDVRNGNYDIYGYNLDTQTEFPICIDDVDIMSPIISGNYVVWSVENGEYLDIYCYDLTSGFKFPVSIDGDYRLIPTTNGNTIILGKSDLSDSERHLYGFSLGDDECLFATEVFKDVPYVGTTEGITGMNVSSCSYKDTKDVWYKFTPTTAVDFTTISLCGSDFDTTLAVYDDCGGVELVCNDDYCGLQSQVTFKAKVDKTYYIRVAGYDGETGNYTLRISGSECVSRPAGDINGDCKVDFQDLAIVCGGWLDCGYDDPNACWQ